MITIAGNPVLSAPGGDELDTAFAQLDYMVSVDIYLNETSRHANIILPATHGLEVPHFDVFFNSFAVRNTVKYSPPLFEKTGDQKPDWEILKLLSSALTGTPDDGATPELLLDWALKTGYYKGQGMSLNLLMDNPHGIDLGPLKPCLDERIRTADSRVKLAPQIFLDDLPRLKNFACSDEGQRKEYPFEMIGRRLARSHNTWTQNSRRLVKGRNPVTLQIHSQDAQQLGIATGQVVAVRSASGHIEIEVDVNDDILPGVVSIPQGWGHNREETRMSVARSQPGVSINSLTDARRVDPVSGTAAFNGTPVAIEAV
jgi:anaerobic selenocysteine-containing dehydrogenase